MTKKIASNAMTLGQMRNKGSPCVYLFLLLYFVPLSLQAHHQPSTQKSTDDHLSQQTQNASQTKVDDGHRLSEFIGNYEFVTYEPLPQPIALVRSKRNSDSNIVITSSSSKPSSSSFSTSLPPFPSSSSFVPLSNSLGSNLTFKSASSPHHSHHHNENIDQSVRIDFEAKGKQFKLRLQPDASSVFSNDLVIESSDGSLLDVNLGHIYSGHLEDDPGSQAFGSIKDGLFEGKIVTSGGTFYVESAARYFMGHRQSNESLPGLEAEREQEQNDQQTSSTTSLPDAGNKSGHSVIYASEDVSHPYLEMLGSGCGSAHGDQRIKDWMDQVSNSQVPGSEGGAKKKAKDHLRSKRSPIGTTPSYSFAREGQNPNEDIWSRNAQSRISHDRKDFYPPHNVVTPQFPSSTIKRRACSLYIQTDTYLWDHIRKDSSSDIKAREEIASLVAQHIKAVNHIYENSDFNGIRGLKFIVQRLKINDSSSCDSVAKRDHNPFCSPNIDVSNFLNLNSQFNHNDFCLAYIFTYRDFSGGTLGLAWVASTSGASGGICEKYKSYTENIHGRQVQTKRSLNTGIITFVNYNSRVPPKVSELTLAHEIGHNFGSPHDYPLDCRPGGSQGNFIMYSSATSGERPNNNKFSPCSIRNISSVLHAVFNSEGKENCFQEDDGPFCGNKIVEEGEECDCGYDMKECTEQCCYPREYEPYLENDPNAKPCTRRRGAICSPSEGPCCSETCRYERSHKLCRHESECTYESFCNGYRASCPLAPSKPNKTECNGGTQVCWRGMCVGSICQKYDLEECFLTSKSGAKSDEMCEVACQRGNDGYSCRRTSEIHQMRNISGLKLRPGSPCNDFQGYCDVFQRCRAVDAEGPLARLKNLLFNQKTLMSIKQWITTYWWACMLSGVGTMLFMAAFIKCCAVHTPSSNPKKKPALRIQDTLRRPADTLRRKRHRQAGQASSSSRGGRGEASAAAVSAAGPPIPLQPSAPPPLAHQYPTQTGQLGPASSGQLIMGQQQPMSGQVPLLPQRSIQPQLVVALPPEHHSNSSAPTSAMGPSAHQRYLPEPPPPYPGHPPQLPPRPVAASSSAVIGPNHGYGEGRGHYNRSRAQQQQQQQQLQQQHLNSRGQPQQQQQQQPPPRSHFVSK